MYKLYKCPRTNEIVNVVIRISDSATIPFAPDNTDYQEYLKWIAAGNTPEPADVPEGE
jgi:hypothetical protein